jgi:hypothetical protein
MVHLLRQHQVHIQTTSNFVFDPFNPNTCYVATDGGVYKSINGGQNWTLQSTNLQATQLLSFGSQPGW